MILNELFESLRTENPCWKGYHPVGTKKKNGRTVPNCVPNANEGVAEGSLEEIDRRGFLKGLGAAAVAGAAGGALAQSKPADISAELARMTKDDPRIQHNKDVNELARAIYERMVAERGQPMDRRQQQQWLEIARLKAEERFSQYAPGKPSTTKPSAGFPSQPSEYRRSRNLDNFESVDQGVAEGSEQDLQSQMWELGKKYNSMPNGPEKEAVKQQYFAIKKQIDQQKGTWGVTAQTAPRSWTQQGVAEGINDDLVYISKNQVAAFEQWMDSEGCETDVPKQEQGQYIVYDYTGQDHTSRTYAQEWNEKGQDLDEGDKVGHMDADKFDTAMARLKQLAGAGPMKTVWDPEKRVYKNVPTAVQPKQQPSK